MLWKYLKTEKSRFWYYYYREKRNSAIAFSSLHDDEETDFAANVADHRFGSNTDLVSLREELKFITDKLTSQPPTKSGLSWSLRSQWGNKIG